MPSLHEASTALHAGSLGTASADPVYFRQQMDTSSLLNHDPYEVELVEAQEVPVVHKQARVVEEVHVAKIASQHTAQVEDTVQHTEIEVEETHSSAHTRNSAAPAGSRHI